MQATLTPVHSLCKTGQAGTSLQLKLRTTKSLAQVWCREVHSCRGRRDEPPSALAAQPPNTHSDGLNPDLVCWAEVAERPRINRNQVNGAEAATAQALLNGTSPLQGILQGASHALR